MRKQISIKDIARMAGVSHSTVSRALRDSPLISPATTARIQKLAAKNGYRASLVARSLVNRETNTVGCVVTSIADPFVAEVVRGVEQTARARGYSVLLATSDASPEREMETVLWLQERRVDGVLVAASRLGPRYGSSLAAMRVPIVLINNQHPGAYMHSVAIDNEPAAELVARHVISLGHRRIACIGDRCGQHSNTERMRGWRSALRAAGITPDPELLRLGDGRPDEAQTITSELLALHKPPTAILCYNDMTALGAMAAVRQAGLNVPRDVSICGFDDLLLSAYVDPPLTTVRQPMYDMGVRSMEMLLDLFAGKRSSRCVNLPGELVVRGSTAPPRRR